MSSDDDMLKTLVTLGILDDNFDVSAKFQEQWRKYLIAALEKWDEINIHSRSEANIFEIFRSTRIPAILFFFPAGLKEDGLFEVDTIIEKRFELMERALTIDFLRKSAKRET